MRDADQMPTPDLATDPPREARLTGALSVHDAYTDATRVAGATPLPAFEARVRAQVETVMAARASTDAVIDARDRDVVPLAVATMRAARRLLPAAALVAALLVVVALGWEAAPRPDIEALAYAGGSVGAAVAGDAALGLPSGMAALVPGGAR